MPLEHLATSMVRLSSCRARGEYWEWLSLPCFFDADTS